MSLLLQAQGSIPVWVFVIFDGNSKITKLEGQITPFGQSWAIEGLTLLETRYFRGILGLGPISSLKFSMKLAFQNCNSTMLK